jgi:hypothetical protein
VCQGTKSNQHVIAPLGSNCRLPNPLSSCNELEGEMCDYCGEMLEHTSKGNHLLMNRAKEL